MKQKIEVPDEINFSDLNLRRVPITGELEFKWEPIEQICAANEIDVNYFKKSHEDNVAGLIVAWYFAHREQGGYIAPVAEELIAEVHEENRAIYESRN